MAAWIKYALSQGQSWIGFSSDQESWHRALWAPAALSDVLSMSTDSIKDFVQSSAESTPADLKPLPLLMPTSRVFCIGKNYKDHAIEMGGKPPVAPDVFTRGVDSFVSCEDAITLPSHSQQLDYEGELAVIIGKPGRAIPREKAYDHIAAYAVANDGSVRDWQKRTSQFTLGKNWDRSGSFSSFARLASISDNFDPMTLSLKTYLNGSVMQNGCTDQMIFDIATLIQTISTVTTLQVGDVILTGTPEGVGFARNPKIFLQAGDVLRISIDGIGSLTTPVKA